MIGSILDGTTAFVDDFESRGTVSFALKIFTLNVI